MEEMYEVLKFIEHGTNCRRSLDCVQGVSLMGWMKVRPCMDRREMLIWFREIALCIDQYHRSGSGQDYRYLNPYSVIVTEENRLMLLDLEAPDNASIIKQMQTGAVRDHFVRPVCDLGISRNHEVDLFAYGKMIQFMLAYMQIQPAFTKMDEMRLERVICRCIGESGKRYGDFTQVLKALPQIPGVASQKEREKKLNLRHIVAGVGIGAAACLCLCMLLGLEKENLVKAEEEAIYKEAENEGKRKAEEVYERRMELLIDRQESEQAERMVSEAIMNAGEKAIDITEKRRTQEVEKQLIDAYNSLLEHEKDPVKAEDIQKKIDELKNNP